MKNTDPAPESRPGVAGVGPQQILLEPELIIPATKREPKAAMMLESSVEPVEDHLDRPFAVTGRRCYLVGAMNVPDLGHHLPGEMGADFGTLLIKLADGFWFGARRP